MSPSLIRKPTFVLVPGIFHTPAHFQQLIDALSKEGYESRPISHRSIGKGVLTAEPGDDARGVRAVLKELIEEQGKDVVVVAHSYGGVPASQALHGLTKAERVLNGGPGGVSRVIFLAAILPKEGESAMDVLTKADQADNPWIEADSTNPAIARHNDLVQDYLFHDLPRVKQTHWASQLQPMSGHSVTTPARNTCWDLDVLKTYIFLSRDWGLWPETQKMMFEAVSDGTWRTKTIESGHSPFLSHVGELVEVLVEN